MPIAPRWPKDLSLVEYKVAFRQQVARKVEAFVRVASPKEKRFVNLHVIALAILQILSLELADSIWQQFPCWFRTLPHHGYPTEQVVRLTGAKSRPYDFCPKQASCAFAKIPRQTRWPVVNPSGLSGWRVNPKL